MVPATCNTGYCLWLHTLFLLQASLVLAWGRCDGIDGLVVVLHYLHVAGTTGDGLVVVILYTVLIAGTTGDGLVVVILYTLFLLQAPLVTLGVGYLIHCSYCRHHWGRFGGEGKQFHPW